MINIRKKYRAIAFDNKIWSKISKNNEWVIIHYNVEELIEKLSTDWFGYQNLIHIPTGTVVQHKKLNRWFAVHEGIGLTGTEFRFHDELDITFGLPILIIKKYKNKSVRLSNIVLAVKGKEKEYINRLSLLGFLPEKNISLVVL
jgi:hypothetical protein